MKRRLMFNGRVSIRLAKYSLEVIEVRLDDPDDPVPVVNHHQILAANRSDALITVGKSLSLLDDGGWSPILLSCDGEMVIMGGVLGYWIESMPPNYIYVSTGPDNRLLMHCFARSTDGTIGVRSKPMFTYEPTADGYRKEDGREHMTRLQRLW